jgi:(4-(4-[2-(gamma-L-glutamylamino)ethyl]phenoxymethyl)furan-2-yl)methanamine synthase
VITMTGELCDAFPSRREGVAGLAKIATHHLAPAAPSLYAGRAGFVELGDAAAHAGDIASANWHASAAVVALKLPDALFIDIGSTTADIIPIIAGQVAAVGYSDAERLASGELIYTGMTRSFVMSLASRAPFRGAWTPLMNEYFASSADVHRILGYLPDGADKMATADGREKTVKASRARLARMIGHEADEGADSEWTGLAAWFAEAQARQITDAALLRLSRNDVPAAAPVVAAGVGESITGEAARRLRRPCLGFSSLIAAPAEASYCAPAVAVALLAANRQALPSRSESL